MLLFYLLHARAANYLINVWINMWVCLLFAFLNNYSSDPQCQSLKSFSFWIFSFITSQILPGRSFIGCNLTTKIFVLTSQWPVQFNKPLQASIEQGITSHHINLWYHTPLQPYNMNTLFYKYTSTFFDSYISQCWHASDSRHCSTNY